jgi:hypothetical protein
MLMASLISTLVKSDNIKTGHFVVGSGLERAQCADEVCWVLHVMQTAANMRTEACHMFGQVTGRVQLVLKMGLKGTHAFGYSRDCNALEALNLKVEVHGTPPQKICTSSGEEWSYVPCIQ